jgi:hypothetical protein
MSDIQNFSYFGARDQIANGDIINIYAPAQFSFMTLLYCIIKFFTKSSVVHSVIALWMSAPSGEKKLMCVESNIKGGKRIVPLSHYMNQKMEVIHLPSDIPFSGMEDVLLARVSDQNYALIDFISIGMKEYFGIQKFKEYDTGGQVCSELCADAWIKAGVKLPETLVSPGKLKADLAALNIHPSLNINF